MQGLEPEMLDDAAQGMRLIVGAQGRKLVARLRRRAAAAAAEIVDTEHAVVRRIDGVAGTDELGPPTLLAVHDAMRRNAAEHRDDGGIRGSDQAKSDACIRQLVAVVQAPGSGERQDLVANQGVGCAANGRDVGGALRLRDRFRLFGNLTRHRQLLQKVDITPEKRRDALGC